MELAELAKLFREEETDLVERKENLADTDKVRQAICAFANDMPNHKKLGVIFIGQRDDRRCANLKIDDKLLLNLSSMRADGKILPLPIMTVRKETIDGCEVAAVIVQPSDNPPVRVDGRAWIRVGPRRGTATVDEERRLVEKRRWGNLPFDAHGVPGASLDDLDLRYFEDEYLPSAIARDVLRQNGRSIEEKLRALRLLKPDGLPTVTAILLMGKEPRAWLPGAYIQFLRIDGEKLTDPIKNQKNIDGTLSEQLRNVDELLELNLEHRTEVGEVLRRDSWDYPIVALRQLARNALLHRNYEGTSAPIRITWYNDRIEMQNPGGPYGQVTKENFGRPGITDYRNPTIAEALRNLNYVEQFGVGIAIARAALSENGNPEPEFSVEDQHVHVTVKRLQ